MSIVDTIDHAISDWETSPDAMRWAADASAPQPASGGIAGLAEALDIPLTQWQQLVLAHPTRMAADFDRVRVSFTAAATQFAEAMKGIGAALRPILDEGLWTEAPRLARVTRLRRAYRAKRRHHW
ncbi:hypothetical protein DKT68_15345 [Micromonospora acroterricola]|uniref:Uncharacterized protein n=1 Tax=Micromonospora acroterricola TaxID=2202421 RepID=A0A317D1M4_9ACTN|nr:hypothetical protein [Micromonospora acroterricola]PWR08589.1 hypothetical protein DKT68_15345 [Micromonospora acroterricola]